MSDAKANQEQRLYYVDRVEGDMAVLVEDSEQAHEWSVPLARLPEGTREGQWLKKVGQAHLVRDEATEKAVKERVRSLMDELSG